MLKGFNVVRKKGICTMKRKGEGVVVALSPEALAMAGWPRSAKADVGVNAKAHAIAVMRSRYGEEGKTYEFEPAVQGKAASSRALVLTHLPRAGAELRARPGGVA